MTRRTLLALCCTGFLTAPAFAGEGPKMKSCCAKVKHSAKHATAEKQTAQKMRCSLTGKVVDKCCCVEREGKTHCTLADKAVDKCCCTPVEDGGKVAAK